MIVQSFRIDAVQIDPHYTSASASRSAGKVRMYQTVDRVAVTNSFTVDVSGLCTIPGQAPWLETAALPSIG